MKNRFVKFILPVHSDTNFEFKKSEIIKLCDRKDIIPILPEYDKIEPDFSLEKMVHEINISTLIIADLNLERPSCYYELGAAEALKSKVSLIALLGTNIHQTIYRDRVIIYDSMDKYSNVILNILEQLPNGTTR